MVLVALLNIYLLDVFITNFHISIMVRWMVIRYALALFFYTTGHEYRREHNRYLTN